MKNWYNKQSKDLINAILALKKSNEAKCFLRDLLTEKEIIEFSKRWQVAKMLYKKISYSQIEKETGMSSTTIARIFKWLNKGMKGYKIILKKSHSHHHNSSSLGKSLR